jgi:hypothetical protein
MQAVNQERSYLMRRWTVAFTLSCLAGMRGLALWGILVWQRDADSEHLAFVEVKNQSLRSEVLKSVSVSLISPWGSETPLRLEKDHVFRAARIKDSGKRMVKFIGLACSTSSSILGTT